MPEMKRPLVYDETHQEHLPISDGQVIGAAYIPISGESGNILTAKEGGLFVRAPETPEIVSVDTGNYLKKGSDDGAMLTGNDVLSNGAVNLLTINPTDGKIQLAAETIRENVDFVSVDGGNIIRPGSDGGAYLTIGDLVSQTEGNRITIAADGLLHVASPVSGEEGNALSEGNDGMAYFHSDLGTIM